MVERITDESILRAKYRFKKSSISIKSAGEDNCILGLIEAGDTFFQLFVDVLSSADKSHWAESISMGIKCPLGRLDEPRVVRETQIIIGTEVKDFFSIDSDLGGLWRADDSFGFVCTLILHEL